MTPDDPKTSLFRYRFASAEFDEARFELRVAGLPVDVQRKPLELLSVLLAHAGEVVTKEELLDVVWQGRPTVENVVANAVAKLRSALGPDGADRIRTVPRLGYRFTGTLERTAVGRSLSSRLDFAPGISVPARPNFLLEAQLSGSDGSEVWTARHGKTRELRVYKFALGGERLAALKREATLYRVLRENLGERRDIARIIDWNFEAPPFFLECEHAGQNLADWSRGPERLAGLALEARLAVFLQIADAVAAAHGVGVLHKDLKPGNVLLAARPDGGWQACLSDFGSGRLLESDRLGDITGMGLTMTRGVLADSGSGTPQYLAPELLAGQPPTVQSDVYALGLLLYQFVVGDLRKPMVSGWERDVDDELLRADVAAATDGDPARRLATVPELTQRLRQLPARHRQRQRLAAAERAAHAAQRTIERNRARRPWLVAAVAALTVGLAASLWLYREARLAGDRLEAMNDFLYEDVLANTGALKTDNDPDPSMRRVLRNAAAIVGERFAQDPGSEGWIRYGVGQGLSGLGDYQGAEQQQRLAVELLTRAHGAAHDRTLLASRGLAMLLLEQSKFDQAEAVLAAVDVMRGAGSNDTVFVMQALRGMLRAARKDCAAALVDLRAAERIPLPATPESAYNRFNVRSWIGETLNCLGWHDEALVHYQLLLGEDLPAEHLGPALIAYARLGHASALLHQGQDARGEAELLDALSLLESAVGEADAFTLGQALVVAGRFYVDRGDFTTAAPYLARGRDLLLTVDERQEKALNALRLLGTIDYCQGELERAAARLTAAHGAFVETYGARSADAQGAGFWLAATWLAVGNADAAAQLADSLDPDAVRVSLGGSDWSRRIDVLRAAAHGPEGRDHDSLRRALDDCPL